MTTAYKTLGSYEIEPNEAAEFRITLSILQLGSVARMLDGNTGEVAFAPKKPAWGSPNPAAPPTVIKYYFEKPPHQTFIENLEEPAKTKFSEAWERLEKAFKAFRTPLSEGGLYCDIYPYRWLSIPRVRYCSKHELPAHDEIYRRLNEFGDLGQLNEDLRYVFTVVEQAYDRAKAGGATAARDDRQCPSETKKLLNATTFLLEAIEGGYWVYHYSNNQGVPTDRCFAMLACKGEKPFAELNGPAARMIG